MAKVLLVKTRTAQRALPMTTSASPPLGLMSLAAFCRQHRPGDEFLLVDERVQDSSTPAWQQRLKSFAPDRIAISAMSVDADRLVELVASFKALAPELPILVGGPHATARGARLLADTAVDYVIKGEGEIALLQLSNALDRGERHPAAAISGLAFRLPDGTVVDYPANTEVPEVETLPIPAWDLADIEAYAHHGRMTPMGRVRYAALFTSRGCPYRCTYCHSIFPKRFRAQSPRRVVDEIEFLIQRHGVHHFEVFDDIFNADYERAAAICDEIRRRRLDTHFCFPNAIRGDQLDRALLQKLRDVGTYEMAFAVESTSERIQRLTRKRINLQRIAENISIAAELGIFTWGFFMIGFPGETRAEIRRTIDFAVGSDLHGAFFFVVVPFEGTELAAQSGSPEQAGALAADYHFSSSSVSELSPTELGLWQTYAYGKVFSRPRRLWRILADYPLERRGLLRLGSKLGLYLAVHRPVGLARTMLGRSP